MPFDSSNAKNMYIASAVGIVLVLYIVVQFSKRQSYKYHATQSIAVKTSKGLIKMHAEAVATRLAAINAEMQKFKGTNTVTRYSKAIQQAMNHIKHMIKTNPKKNFCNLEKKASVVDQALSDFIIYDEAAASQSWNTIVEQDSIDYMNDKDAFVYLLGNMEALITMLHNEVCEDGILDLDMLEQLLYFMEKDLVTNGRFEMSLGNEIGNRYDPYEIRKVPLFIREQGQLEGFDSLENFTKPNKKIKPLVNLGVHNKLQDRSESFRTNNNVLSHNLVDDETLLLDTGVNGDWLSKSGTNFIGYI